MNIKKIISSIGIGAGAIILGLGIQYALANWTQAPPGTPPNCPAGYAGCDAPINVGTSAQAKNGSLSIGTSVATTSVSLDVEGKLSWLTGLIDNGPFQLIDAGALAGTDANKVLTSDASGNARWATPSGGGVVPSGTIMGYGIGSYNYNTQTVLSCSISIPVSPFICSGTSPSCLQGWSLITIGNQYGSCANTTCFVSYICAKN